MEHEENTAAAAAVVCRWAAEHVGLTAEVHGFDVGLEGSVPHHRQFPALPCFLKVLEVETEETASELALRHCTLVHCGQLFALPCSPTVKLVSVLNTRYTANYNM